MQIPDLNPDSIADLATHQIVIQLLNVIEMLAAENVVLRVEHQNLRDAVARLKGRSGTPAIKPPTPPSSPPPADHSSEAERRTRTPRGKPNKNANLIVTQAEHCVVEPATLPPDAVRHGPTATIVQRLRIDVEVVRFVRERWYVPSTNTLLTAPLPPGFRGGLYPTPHPIVPALGYEATVSQPALLRLLRDVGLQIGTRLVARMLLEPTGRWADEAAAIHPPGLATESWVATDQTRTPRGWAERGMPRGGLRLVYERSSPSRRHAPGCPGGHLGPGTPLSPQGRVAGVAAGAQSAAPPAPPAAGGPAPRHGHNGGDTPAAPTHRRDHAHAAAGTAGRRCAGPCHLSRPNPGARPALVAAR